MITRNRLLLLLPLLIGMTANAQRFQPNAFGHVDDPAFLQLIKERGYELVSSFQSDPSLQLPLALVKKADNWYRIDANGVEYDSKQTAETQLRKYPEPVITAKDERFQIVESYGKCALKAGDKIIFEKPFGSLEGLNNGFYVFSAGGKAGVIDTAGRQVIPMRYDEIDYDQEYGRFFCYDSENNLTSICNNAGEVLSKQYAHMRFDWYYGSLYRVRAADSEKYGLYDIAANTLVLPCNYHSIASLHDNRIHAPFSIPDDSPKRLKALGISDPSELSPQQLPQLFGILDSAGKILLQPQFEEVDVCDRSHYIIVREKDRYGVVDLQGKRLLPSSYEKLVSLDYDFLEEIPMPAGLLIFTEKEKYGVMTIDRKVLVQPQYDRLTPTSDGLLAVSGERCGMLSHDGTLLLPFREMSVIDVHRGIIRARIDDKRVELDLYGNSSWK